MTPQELRNSIIKKALEGKLIDQSGVDGNGTDLLKAIKKEKECLIKKGLLKKEKGLKPLDTSELYDGSSVSSNQNGIEFHQGKIYFGESVITQSPFFTIQPTKIAPPSSILLCVRAPVGKINWTDRELCIGRGLCAIVPIHLMCKEYVYYVLTYLETHFNEKSTGTTFKAIGGDTINCAPFPLPPLEEQKRIVSKIEELLPLVDRYEEVWNKLDKLNSEFPTDMELSIIKHALQGKLVEQKESEGTGFDLFDRICKVKKELVDKKLIKKDKTIETVSEDDLPFEIPSSWKWVYLGEIFLHNTGKAQNSSGSTNGTIRKFITTSNLYWNRFDFSKIKEMPFTDTELERCTIKKGDLLVCEGGDYGRSAIWNYDEEMCIQNHVHRLRPYYGLDINFYYYMMFYYKNAGLLRGRGVAIQGLSNEAIHKVACPLPPYEEQKRIVDRIEELLPLCRKLIK